MTANLAFVFPGQGSQSVAMVSDFVEQFELVTQTFQEASEVLSYDLKALVLEGPADKLNQTAYTQPALLAADVALWRVWQSLNGATPQFMAGHSLGEYSALVCAGVIDFKDAVRVVSARGSLMQEAVPADQGAMAAIIGLDNDQVNQLCGEQAQGGILSPANYNSPGQVVVAGDAAAVLRAVEAAKQSGARLATILPVSVPSHCALMNDIAQPFAELLASIRINAASIPVLNNVDVAAPSHADDIREALVRQLYSPVRWAETIQTLYAEGISQFIECGPGKVLTGLGKRIEKQAQHTPIGTVSAMQACLDNFS